MGLELQVGYDFGIANDAVIPDDSRLTWTEAEFESGASSEDGESIFSGAKKGNEVTYILKYSFMLGAYSAGKYTLARWNLLGIHMPRDLMGLQIL